MLNRSRRDSLNALDEDVFRIIAHPIRRKILQLLEKEEMSYSDLMDALSLESGSLGFHIRKLQALVTQGSDGKYTLSYMGKQVLQKVLEVTSLQRAKIEIPIFLSRVEKVYKTGSRLTYALRGIDLEVEEGEFLVILGPSGSGKTTLLNMIGGIDYATSGEVIILGQNLGEMNETELALFRRKCVGFVFQTFNLVSTLTAKENVMISLDLSGVPVNRAEEDTIRLLDRVGLADLSGFFPSQLSIGEQQRVAIARALIRNPPILLADEPTANLDAKTGKEIIDLLKGFNEEEGNTFVVVSSDPRVAKKAARVLLLTDGRIKKRK